MSSSTVKLRIQLTLGGIFVTLLLAAVFTLGSLHVPLEPQSWREVIALYAVSSFITAALLIFGQLGFLGACITSATLIYDRLDFDLAIGSPEYVDLMRAGTIAGLVAGALGAAVFAFFPRPIARLLAGGPS